MQTIDDQPYPTISRSIETRRSFHSSLFNSAARLRRRSSPSTASCHLDSPDAQSSQCDLARSLSFKINDLDNTFQSFCPSDLEFRELLGKGCFGEVYKVVHKRTGAVMVLKCLYRMDQRGEADFLQEAAFMRSLCHPNVLAILGVLYKDKKLHIVSEYISCGSLRACLESQKQLSWLQRLGIAKDVSAGMAYLHSKRIIHRDLTSSNILLREKYANAVVADFGLALMVSRRLSRKRRVPVGDPYVMAPEMIREQPYDERADLFSFGVTLCEMIGQCSVDPDVLLRTKNFGIDRDAFLSRFLNGSDCPTPFYEIAFKCASVDPQDRPPFSLVFDWITSLMAIVSSQDLSDLDQCVDEIRNFTLGPVANKNRNGTLDPNGTTAAPSSEPPPALKTRCCRALARLSSSLSRLPPLQNRRKASLGTSSPQPQAANGTIGSALPINAVSPIIDFLRRNSSSDGDQHQNRPRVDSIDAQLMIQDRIRIEKIDRLLSSSTDQPKMSNNSSLQNGLDQPKAAIERVPSLARRISFSNDPGIDR